MENSELDIYLSENGDIHGYDHNNGKFTYMFKRFENLNSEGGVLSENDIIELAEMFVAENLSYSEKYRLDKIYYSDDTKTYYTTFYAYINEYKCASFCCVNFMENGEIKNYIFKDNFSKFTDLNDISIDLEKQNEKILKTVTEKGFISYDIEEIIIDMEENKILVNYHVRFYTADNCVADTIQVDYNEIKCI